MRHRLLSILTCIGLAAVSCSRTGQATGTLPVAAAASLRELLEMTAPRFEAAHPGLQLRFSFDASSVLSRQIEAGGEYHVFFSADRDNVERIASLTEAASTRAILSNTLALVGRDALESPPRTLADLEHASGKIAMAGPQVPVGKYARAYLGAKHLLSLLEPRMVVADNVRAALAMVEAGATDFAFVYVTDAKVAKKAKLLWTAPAGEGPEIVYVATVVTRYKTKTAEAYLEWLSSPEFLAAAQSLGFLAPIKS